LVMDNVMADLEFAVANVREDVPTGTPGKWVVALAEAKIALHEGTCRKYHGYLDLEGTADALLQKAAATAARIMAESGHSIYNTGNPETDYAALFGSQDLLNNPEVMLASIFDQTRNRSQNAN